MTAGDAVLGARMHRQSADSRAEEAWLSPDGMQQECGDALCCNSLEGWMWASGKHDVHAMHDMHDMQASAEKTPGDTIVAAKNRSTWVMPSEDLPNVAVRRVDRVHATIANMRFLLRFPIYRFRPSDRVSRVGGSHVSHLRKPRKRIPKDFPDRSLDILFRKDNDWVDNVCNESHGPTVPCTQVVCGTVLPQPTAAQRTDTWFFSRPATPPESGSVP